MWNKIKALTFIIFVLVNVSASENEKIDIIRYYNLLPTDIYLGKSTLLKHQIYKIFMKDDKWVAKSLDDKLIYPLVDFKNAYLDVKDVIEKGFLVSIEQEATIFKSKKMTVIGLSISNNFTLGNNFYFRFYKIIKGNKIIDVTKETIQHIDYNLFVKKKYNKNELIELNKIIPESYIICKLPRYGTKLKFYLDESIKYLNDHQDSKHNRKIVENFINNVNFSVVEFEWNQNIGMFELLK
jgi:hypothetical protein